MRTAVMGAALLLMSCGGGSGQTGAAGGGAAGGVGGQTGGTAGGSASCAAASGCGGDIVGTWKVTQSCLTAAKDLSSVCAGASADIEYMLSGTVIYSADGTYSSALGGTGTFHEHYPIGCAPFGLTCDQLGQSAMQAIDAGTIISYSCSTDSAGGCNCDSVAQLTTTNTLGTYSTSRAALTHTHDGITSTSSYCVQGGVLHEIIGPGDGGLTSMGDIVLTKQ
jgi:hypothetical protein